MKVLISDDSEVTNAINYFIIVDLSGSMYDYIDDLKKIFIDITNKISDKDTLTFGYFSGYNEFDWICKFSNIKNMDFKFLLDNMFYSRGLTCYTQILNSFLDLVANIKILNKNSDSCMYFLSDGCPNDNSPHEDIYELCKKISKSVKFNYICGFGGYYSRCLLENMTSILNAQFIHASNTIDIESNYNSFINMQKKMINIKLDKKYDYIWQLLDDDIFIYHQNDDMSINIVSKKSELYHYNDINECVKDPRIVYAFVYTLSKLNKSNMGVQLLLKYNCLKDANFLRKSFTPSQKGECENYFKNKIFNSDQLDETESTSVIQLYDFISHIQSNLGKCEIKDFIYKTSTRKTNFDNNVKINKIGNGIITKIISNEKRPNLSFQVKYNCEIVEILDENLNQKLDEYNNTHSKKILLPFKTEMYRTYSFISNGNINFEKITIDDNIFYPKTDIDIFSDINELVTIEKFYQLNIELIKLKNKLSFLKLSKDKYDNDLRIELYGEDSLDIFNDIGLDSKLRYTGKRVKNNEDKKKDFITYQSFSSYIKGASTISIKKCYENYISKKSKKQTMPEKLTFPLFEEYENKKNILNIDQYKDLIKLDTKHTEYSINIIKSQLSNIKFYMMMTNTWFDNIPKKDTIEYKDLIIKIKEEREYL